MVLKTLSYLSKSKLSERFPKFKETIEGIEDRYCQWREYAGPKKFEERYEIFPRPPGDNQKTSEFINGIIKRTGANPSEQDVRDFILNKFVDGEPTK